MHAQGTHTTYAEISDEILVKETALNGDMDAFAELYRRYNHAVQGYLYRRMHEGHAALEDIAQDAWADALTAIGQYCDDPGGRAFGQWICGRAGRALRRSRWTYWEDKTATDHATGELIRELRDELMPWAADPSGSGRPAEVTEELREAIANLRPRDRQAIELHYFDGLTFNETATAMDCKPSQVAYLLARAVGELRDPDSYGRQQPHDAMDKWARLIEAAREVIDEVGLQAATGTEIARRAGLAQKHINTKFGSLDGLLRAALGDRAPALIRPARRPAKEAVLDAARQILAESGREAATSAAVAERAGYSRRVITKHYGTLANLLAEAA